MSTSADWTKPGYNPADHGWFKADTGENNFGYPENYFFADSMRALSIAFGEFFKDVYVIRYDELGYPRKRIQVPIKFGPRAKSHDQRTEIDTGNIEDGIISPKYYIQNPNMSWIYSSLAYSTDRSTSTNAIRSFYNKYMIDNGVDYNICDLVWQDTMPIPYDIGIILEANCDKMSDANQIIEQICTKFKPESFVYIKEFWFMNIRRDIKMLLESTNMEISSDNIGEDAKREIKVKFTFKLDGWFYKPISNGSLITSIVTTLNPNVNGHPENSFGISGNAYINENKYKTVEDMKNASGYFDGSLTSGYDFTKNGTVSIGPSSALTNKYIVSGNNTYTEYYEYTAIPDTLVEYNNNFKILTATTYNFNLTGGITNIDYNYLSPYITTGSNQDYVYGNKQFLDSKQNIINTVYATSVTSGGN